MASKVSPGTYRLTTAKWPGHYMYMQDSWDGNVRGWGADAGPEGWWIVQSHPREPGYFLISTKRWPDCYIFVQNDPLGGNVRGWNGEDPGPQGWFKVIPHPSNPGFHLITVKQWENQYFLYMQRSSDGNIKTWYGDPGDQGWWKFERWHLDEPHRNLATSAQMAQHASLGGAPVTAPVVHSAQASNRSLVPDSYREATGPQACGAVQVVLHCEHAAGISLAGMSSSLKSITLVLDPLRGSQTAVVGKQHQCDFFERLVPDPDRRSVISRSHFEVTMTSTNSDLLLRKVSQNKLLVNDREVQVGEDVPLREGSFIAFNGVDENDPRILVLRVAMNRNSAAMPTVPNGRSVPVPGSNLSSNGPIAVLECIQAIGTDLQAIPMKQRIIPLALDQCVEVGRERLPGFFERLLSNNQAWLGFISRSHFRAWLSMSGGNYSLKVENISGNPILVGGQQMPKGGVSRLAEGGTLGFPGSASAVTLPAMGAAPPTGDTVAGRGATAFLEFRLRRAQYQD